MKVAILGYAVDGISSANYWHNKGDDITICDLRTDIDLPDYASSQLGSNYLNNLDRFDLLVRTPGLHLRDIVAANLESPDIVKKITTNLNEFFANCPAPIIGVTGTKGKGTTCTLIYKILQTAGKQVFIGGNIGKPPLDFLNDITADAYVILEISNFQLIDFRGRAAIAVCLMLVPEHQDWHHNVQEYYTAKEKLFSQQTDHDIAIYNANNQISKKVAFVSLAKHIGYSVPTENTPPATKEGAYVAGKTIFMKNQAICQINEVALLGRHNLENICAAITVVWQIIGNNLQPIVKVLKTFSGMEHRLEFVRELNHVKYYNDSFATTPEATIAAIKTFKQPKVIILGGHDKGIPFFDLINEIIKSNTRRVIIVGDTGTKMIELFTARGFKKITLGGNTMREIVQSAQHAAKTGDVVLLSTACASFGLFKNYKDRGDQFKTIVNSL